MSPHLATCYAAFERADSNELALDNAAPEIFFCAMNCVNFICENELFSLQVYMYEETCGK